MKSTFLMLLLSMALVGCASMGGSSSGAPFAAMESEFIADASPLSNPKTQRLSEFAATLPAYHSKNAPEKIRSGEWGVESGSAWALPADGKQPSVHIQRLSSSSKGAPRIKVMIGPGKRSSASSPSVWIYELERKSGGWKQLLAP
ncbi:hypothetical protein [Haloferula sp.]|uniref:hypothetical protein n=1 Tax=Haloferula sp. TaxID=2497595 RepID=UPI0032A0A3A8